MTNYYQKFKKNQAIGPGSCGFIIITVSPGKTKAAFKELAKLLTLVENHVKTNKDPIDSTDHENNDAKSKTTFASLADLTEDDEEVFDSRLEFFEICRCVSFAKLNRKENKLSASKYVDLLFRNPSLGFTPSYLHRIIPIDYCELPTKIGLANVESQLKNFIESVDLSANELAEKTVCVILNRRNNSLDQRENILARTYDVMISEKTGNTIDYKDAELSIFIECNPLLTGYGFGWNYFKRSKYNYRNFKTAIYKNNL